ncbi:hypothetical protein JCM11641_007724 [Rhodosporidiobolus odoratus]
MRRIPRALYRTPGQPRYIHSTPRSRSSPPRPHPASTPDDIQVDDLCIPLEPPYSISDYLPSPSQTPTLSRETLLKLHRLAALQPPHTEQGWNDLKDLDELVAIVQAVRHVDTGSLGLQPGEMVDARVRAEDEPVDWETKVELREPVEQGQELLKLAPKTEGGYFVAPSPQNIKTRKPSLTGSSDESVLDEEY